MLKSSIHQKLKICRFNDKNMSRSVYQDSDMVTSLLIVIFLKLRWRQNLKSIDHKKEWKMQTLILWYLRKVRIISVMLKLFICCIKKIHFKNVISCNEKVKITSEKQERRHLSTPNFCIRVIELKNISLFLTILNGLRQLIHQGGICQRNTV